MGTNIGVLEGLEFGGRLAVEARLLVVPRDKDDPAQPMDVYDVRRVGRALGRDERLEDRLGQFEPYVQFRELGRAGMWLSEYGAAVREFAEACGRVDDSADFDHEAFYKGMLDVLAGRMALIDSHH